MSDVLTAPDLIVPQHLKLPGTLWRPERVELKTRTGLVVVDREVYDGCTYRTKGRFVAEFSSAYIKATKGYHAGQPLSLRPHQREVIDAIMRVGDDGRRMVRTAIVQAPRKWGKSQVAVPIALFFLFLPDGDGEPEIIGAAGDRKQAALVFNEAKKAVQADPYLAKRVKVYRDAIEVIDGPTKGGTYKVISNDSGSAMGLNPSIIIADEVATWYGSELWYALSLATAARKAPLMLAISTPGWAKDSLYHNLCKYGAKVNSGELDDPAFYYRPFSPSTVGADWRSLSTWLEANPGLGDYLNPDFFEDAIKVTREADFRTFNLSEWVNNAEAWITEAQWDACNKDADGIIERGEDVVVVFDGSRKNDSTAAVVCTRDGRVGIARRADGSPCIWEKPLDADESWRVSVTDVEDALREVCAEYSVTQLAMDPWFWNHTMQTLAAEGYPVTEFPMGQPKRMVQAASRFEQGIYVQDLKHDGDPTLRRHVLNMTLKTDAQGSRPVKMALSKKIDAGICAVAGFHLATQVAPVAPAPVVPQVVNIWED